MSTWYAVRKYSSHRIEEVDVIKFTDKSIWLVNSFTTLPERHARSSEYSEYYPTWEEAHAFLLGKYAREVADLKEQTQTANSILGQIKKMKKPVQPPSE